MGGGVRIAEARVWRVDGEKQGGTWEKGGKGLLWALVARLGADSDGVEVRCGQKQLEDSCPLRGRAMAQGQETPHGSPFPTSAKQRVVMPVLRSGGLGPALRRAWLKAC